MRRKVAGIVAGVILSALAFTAVVQADATFGGFAVVKVLLNGQEVTSDVPAVNLNGRTMLPLRKMAELLGLTIEHYDAETSTVHMSSQGSLAELKAENERLKATLAALGGEAVATVNGRKIGPTDLYNRMLDGNGARVLDDLIRESLISQAAEKAGVTVTDAEVKARIAKIAERLGGDDALQGALQQNNLTMAAFQGQVVLQLKATKVLLKEIPVTDALLKPFFETNKSMFDTRKVHARHILVQTEEDAKAVKAELDGGADFATVAKAKSVDPSAQTNGGDLGTFGPGQMVPEFEQVVFSLKAGEVSQPFQTPFGWHVAQVVEITGTAPDFEALKAQVTDAYIETQVQRRLPGWVAELYKQATITNNLGK